MTIQQKLDALPNLNHQAAIGQQGHYCKCLEARLALYQEAVAAYLEASSRIYVEDGHMQTDKRKALSDLRLVHERLKEGL